MVDQTNVNDAQFLNDWYRNNDVVQDLNTVREIGRNIMVDMYGIVNAYIFSGLTVEDGFGANQFQINAGRCRDYQKYHIVIPAPVNNIDALDIAGAWNYIAVEHQWLFANPDAPVKGGVAYNRLRSDDYNIDVKLAPAHVEANGWVRLARARKIGGIWEYDMEFTEGNPNYGRSRTAELESWSIDFTHLGAPGAGVLMNRHDIPGGPPGGPTGDLWRVPFDFLVCRVEVDARVAGGNNTDVDLWQNGAFHANWGAAADLILLAGNTNDIWYHPEGIAAGGAMQYYKDDLIQVELASAGFPTDIVVLISGRKTGNV